MPLLLVAMLMQAATVPNSAPAEARDGRSGPLSGTTGQIVGMVVSDEAQPKPVRHARVTCSSADVAHGQTTVTDDGGRFMFSGLASGRYSVAVTKPAWVTTVYGASRPGRPGTPVPVENGRRVELTIRMPHGAVITGVISDEMGRPAAGVPVRAMRYVFSNGERRLQPAGSGGTAGPDGRYRVYGLPPGDYFIGATDQSSFSTGELRLTSDLDVQHALQDPPAAPAPPMKLIDVAPTYFPGTTAVAQASLISVRSGEERAGVDFGLQLVSASTIEGTVAMTDGTLPQSIQLTLLPSTDSAGPGLPGAGFRIARPGPRGQFSIGEVAPGQYTLVARATIPSPGGGAPSIVWASADISAQGDPVTGVSLILEPSLTLSGRVQFEGSTLAPPDMKTVRVSLFPASNQGPTIAPGAATVRSDGTFVMSGMTPGRYRLTALVPGSKPSSGWSVRSAIVNGQDTLDAPLTVESNQDIAGAVITFTDHPARLTGSLEHSSGAAAPEYTIILFAADHTFWQPQSRRIQTTRPAADGAYTFSNIPPGDYLLAAVDDVEPGEWFDPSFLQSLVPAAMKIAIGEGEQKVQDVRLGGDK